MLSNTIKDNGGIERGSIKIGQYSAGNYGIFGSSSSAACNIVLGYGNIIFDIHDNNNGIFIYTGRSSELKGDWSNCSSLGFNKSTLYINSDGINKGAGSPSIGIGEIDSSGENRGTLNGTWILPNNILSASEVQTTSDQNKKNNIESIPDTYNTLFDNLNSVIYKYNDGTSNRYHTGFIAQDVKNAIDTAGLTAQDFAALCIDGENTENEVWRLRYGEFVALNTWQIQKLKKRISELEERLDMLEK